MQTSNKKENTYEEKNICFNYSQKNSTINLYVKENFPFQPTKFYFANYDIKNLLAKDPRSFSTQSINEISEEFNSAITKGLYSISKCFLFKVKIHGKKLSFCIPFKNYQEESQESQEANKIRKTQLSSSSWITKTDKKDDYQNITPIHYENLSKHIEKNENNNEEEIETAIKSGSEIDDDVESEIEDINKELCRFQKEIENNKEKDVENKYLIPESREPEIQALTVTNSKIDEDSTEFNQVKVEKIIKGNGIEITGICLAKDGRLVISSQDPAIKLFNLENYLCEMVLMGHTKGVLDIITLDNGEIVSCSNDRTIMFWEITQNFYKCRQIKKYNKIIFKQVKLSQNRIASCGYDKSLTIWGSNLPNSVIMAVFCTEVINSLIEFKNEKYIAFTQQDNNLVIICNNSYTTKKKMVINSISKGNNTLVEIKDMLIVGEENGVTFIDTATLSIHSRIVEKEIGSVTSVLQLNDNIFALMISSNKELQNYLRCINIESKKVPQFLVELHSQKINKLLQIDKNKFITSSEDGVVKIWSIN